MSVSIARWLLDEASSGTAPLTVFDSVGDNDLTVDYSSGDAVWASVAEGNGIDFTALPATANTAFAQITDITTVTLGESLDFVTSGSYILRSNIVAGHANGARLIHVGTSGGNGDFAIVAEASRLVIRWDRESGGLGGEVDYSLPAGLTTVGVTINTLLTLPDDRCKVYFDGVLQTKITGTVPQNVALEQVAQSNRYFALGNRPSADRNIQGQIYYAEVLLGDLTAQDHLDAHNALVLNNDTAWFTPDTIAPILSLPTAIQNGSGVADLTVTTDEGNGTLFGVVTASATPPSVAQIQAGQDHLGASAFWSGSQNVLATGIQNQIATVLVAGTYYYHSQQIDLALNDSAIISTVSFIIVAIRGITNIDTDNDIQAGQTSVPIAGLFDLPVSSVLLDGEVLNVVGTPTTTNIDVDAPLHIDIGWGSTMNTLTVTDATGALTLNNVTLLIPAGWETVVFNGTAPNPTTTESYYEEAITDLTFTMAVNDVLGFESATGLSVDVQTLPTISPPSTVTGDYKIYDDSLGTWTSVSQYTWTDGASGPVVVLPNSVDVAVAAEIIAAVINHVPATVSPDSVDINAVVDILNTVVNHIPIVVNANDTVVSALVPSVRLGDILFGSTAATNEAHIALFKQITGVSTYQFNEAAIAYYKQISGTNINSLNDALKAAQSSAGFNGLSPNDWRNF